MIWTKWWVFLMTFLYVTFCYSEEDKNEPLKKHQSQVSEDLAQVLWNVMKTYEGYYSFEELSVNLWKLNTGRQKSMPLNECYASLMESLEKKAADQGIFNLQAADSYLQKIRMIDGVNELVKDKLYYKVINSGTGKVIKDLNRSSPLISFKEKSLNEGILSENISGTRLPLSEMIAGLRNGLEGIRVGEKREIFIHPDLAYGEFPKPEPYSLIVIEVTLISP